MSYLSPTLTLLVGAVKKATASLDRDFNEIEKLQSSVRGYQNFVSRSFERVAQTLKSELSRLRPDAGFVDGKQFDGGTAKEQVLTLGSGKPPLSRGCCFMVNPIDGMGNFVRGIPVFATTVAYCENGEVKASVVYNRASDELYFAEKGSGAYKEGFRNHERLRVSAVKDGTAALVAASIGFQHGSAEYTAAYRDLFAETENVRLLGSVALSLAGVAAGKMDVCLSLGSNLNSAVAGLLLVREAGGYVYNLKREEFAPEKIEQVIVSDELAATNTSLEAFIVRLAG